MTLPESIERYESYIGTTADAIAATVASSEGVEAAQHAIQHSSRVLFTGSGSSVPAALLGAQLITRHSAQPAIFAPSSLILDDIVLTSSDVVVLISQGWNRADAALISRKVLKSPATLIVLTGHPERIDLYTKPTDNLIIVPIYPEVEKIFCRPASAVTGYIKIAQLVEHITGKIVSAAQWQRAYETGLSAKASDISRDQQYVVLASGLLLCAGNNVSLSLREGAGRYATLHEIESYGHGQYVPDQAHRAETRYILLTNDEDQHSQEALDRIMFMLEGTGSLMEKWNSSGTALIGNVELMGRTARNVLASIQSDGWDMNNPPGMEENRPFHEVEQHA